MFVDRRATLKASSIDIRRRLRPVSPIHPEDAKAILARSEKAYGRNMQPCRQPN